MHDPGYGGSVKPDDIGWIEPEQKILPSTTRKHHRQLGNSLVDDDRQIAW